MIPSIGPKLPSNLPKDYLEVMLPELAKTGQLQPAAHKQVLDILEKEGFQPAVSMLSVLMTIEMFRGPLQ